MYSLKKMFKTGSVIFICCFLLPAIGFSQAGLLDVTFGNAGIVRTDIANANDYGFSTVVQPDGKILVAGISFTDTVTYNDFVILRYKTNGSLDSSFGTNGIVTTTFGSSDDEAWSMCLQVDGKIVVAGRALFTNHYDFAIARYNINGSLDNTFDGDGKVTTNLGGQNDYANCVKMQSDGKIVVTGFTNTNNIDQLTTVRYNSNGSLDATFDTDGIVITQVAKVYIDGQSMAIQSDGKIVASATVRFPTNEYDVLMVRYNTNGSLDSTFDSDGIVTTDMCYTDNALAIAIQNDGKIIVAGNSYDTINIAMGKNVLLARYNTNGTLDNTFNGNGKVFVEVTNQADFANAIAIQDNGKIIVAGRSADGVGDFKIILVRLNDDGTLDNTFNNDGLVITNMASAHEYGQGIAIQNDGKIIVTGFFNDGATYDIFVARYLGDAPLQTDDIIPDPIITVFPNPCSTHLMLQSEIGRAHV